MMMVACELHLVPTKTLDIQTVLLLLVYRNWQHVTALRSMISILPFPCLSDGGCMCTAPSPYKVTRHSNCSVGCIGIALKLKMEKWSWHLLCDHICRKLVLHNLLQLPGSVDHRDRIKYCSCSCDQHYIVMWLCVVCVSYSPWSPCFTACYIA